MRSGENHCLISGNRCHRGESIHGLGAGDARHQLNRKGAELLSHDWLQPAGIVEWLEKTNNHSVGLETPIVIRFRTVYTSKNICSLKQRGSVADLRACRYVITVAKTGLVA